MSLDLYPVNPYQQKKRAVQHKNHPKRPTTIYHNLFFRQTIIQINTPQTKNISYSQEPLDFTLSKKQLLIHQQHQNQM